MIENPLAAKLAGHTLILASGSPRRKRFFEELGIPFEIRLKSVEEVYPETLQREEIPSYLAQLKASMFTHGLQAHEILITSDTLVWHNGTSLAKASSEKEALQMLRLLSGGWHEVITSVCLTTNTAQKTVFQSTQVKFAKLSEDEISYYVNAYRPFDKAGAYGIQEWIGLVGIEEINGSYTNVVGLPTHLVYKTLMDMVS
ncbi:MAG: Maf family nucleotide pyrophosphatase [Bacteroidota bacterium]